MDRASQLSRAKLILVAVNYAADTNITALQQLTSSPPHKLPLDIILRILLTFLPESVDPPRYALFLQFLLMGISADHHQRLPLDFSAVEDVSESEAHERVRSLRLLPLRYPETTLPVTADVLSTFLVHRAHRIDAQTGLLNLLPPLIVPFLDHSRDLRLWFISRLLPALRHNYEYYGHIESGLALADMEKLEGFSAVKAILSRAGAQGRMRPGESSNIARDLRGMICPWVYGAREQKRRKLGAPASSADAHSAMNGSPTLGGLSSTTENGLDMSDWYDVFRWLVSTASENFALAVEAVENWGGPWDIDLGGYEETSSTPSEEAVQKMNLHYSHVAFAAIYAAPDASSESLSGISRILSRVERLIKHEPPLDLEASLSTLPLIDADFTAFAQLPRSLLLSETALKFSNPFLIPNKESLLFLHALWLSSSLVAGMEYDNSLKGLADLCLFSTEDVQKEQLKRCVRGISQRPKNDDKAWIQARKQLLWLWRWGLEEESLGPDEPSAGSAHGLFGRVGRKFLEMEVLKALLNGSHYYAVVAIYLKPGKDAPVSFADVEQAVINVAMSFYDNASNCNRTRGGMRKASEIITTFYPDYFPNSATLAWAEKLLTATHALSFYALTLQHGVPFRPVTIRAHQDPISLIGKVLEQNPRSYAKLDELLDIGRNLVGAGQLGLKTSSSVVGSDPVSEAEAVRMAEQRITGMAIEAALAEDDFETAYDYVLNRSPVKPPGTEDDISWRAAFQAGRYRPMHALARSSRPSSSVSASDRRGLEMRMELLSHALQLAPPAALSGILATWRQCEDELNALLAQEVEEEESWEEKDDRRMPGGSVSSLSVGRSRAASTRGAGEEAPIGLFDVARGAAAALSKSAFPSVGIGTADPADAGSVSTRTVSGDGDGRARKRDMVSNLVTGGLASGIGWVLGASPVPSGPSQP